MGNELSPFAPIPSHPEIWSAQKGTLRCTALRLSDGTLCLYSPVLGLGGEAKASLAALGEVSYLLAPNHYHHKGLAEYAEAFPKAKIVCSGGAQTRLEKQTGLTFERLERLEALLPVGSDFAEPDGLKTGEVGWSSKPSKTACGSFATALRAQKAKWATSGKRSKCWAHSPPMGSKTKMYMLRGYRGALLQMSPQ